MKKLFSLLALALIINSCNDGDLTQETINFDTSETQSCSLNNLIYKLKDKEALILEIPSTNFINDATPDGSPKILNIGSSENRVIYRFYDGTVSSASICNVIPERTPIAIDQWTATSGIIQITSSAIKTTDSNTNSTRITGYNHNITLKNITFAINNGEQIFRSLPFGDFKTTATSLPFNFEKLLTKCSSTNLIYDYKSNEALLLEIDPTLIANAVTPANSPRTGLINATTNKLTYRLFSGLLTPDYFCGSTTPTSPLLSQEWNAINGIPETNGIIEVTTTTNGPNTFKHTITLKKVSLKRGNSSFSLGDSYLLGELNTKN